MEDVTYTPTGSVLSLIGLVVTGLAHYGFIINQSEAISIVGGFVTLSAIIYQWYTHRSLAVKVGAKGV